jgi:hypothetical protein
MNKALIPLTLRTFAAFALASAFSLPAFAAPAPVTAMAKPPASGCADKVFVKPGQNLKSGHSYLFMMVFKAGTGGKYFGNADYATTGCIGVVPDPKAMAKAAKPAKQGLKDGDGGDVYSADICPTDCVEPVDEPPGAKKRTIVGVKPLDKGTDPLGTYNWGVLSALETPIGTPVADNTFEVWQVRVKDACMAKELYAYYSQSGQFLATARAAGDFMGQMLMGFRVKANGQTEACK